MSSRFNRANHPVHGRAAVADFICPDNGFRGRQARKGITPKDFMKENYRQLRMEQARRKDEAAAEEREKASPRKSQSKLIQFQNVESRVYEPTQAYNTARSNGTVFLTRGASQKRLQEMRQQSIAARKDVEEAKKKAEYYSTERPATPTKLKTPKASDRGVFKPRSRVDFVQENKQAQVMAPQSPSRADESNSVGAESSTMSTKRHGNFGRVPKYLEQRKAEWKVEQDRIARENADKDCPAGMTLMKEDERLATLETLEQSKVECSKQLAKLPFVVETPSLRKKVESLESRLKEIENAIILFSKPKVYIAKDV